MVCIPLSPPILRRKVSTPTSSAPVAGRMSQRPNKPSKQATKNKQVGKQGSQVSGSSKSSRERMLWQFKDRGERHAFSFSRCRTSLKKPSASYSPSGALREFVAVARQTENAFRHSLFQRSRCRVAAVRESGAPSAELLRLIDTI